MRRQRPRTRALAVLERRHKQAVRERDLYCRFPKCGCNGLGLEVSHDRHKGMGGDPTGERSRADVMTLLCNWRHREGKVSRHAGTLRSVYLTDRKANGPIAWEIQLSALKGCKLLPEWIDIHPGQWFEVARELDVQIFKPFTEAQHAILAELARMKL